MIRILALILSFGVVLSAQSATEVISGPVEVLIEDYAEYAHVRYHVNGREIVFKGKGKHDQLQSGQRIKVKGKKKGEALVEAELEEVLALEVEPAPTCTYKTCGEQSLLIVSVQLIGQTSSISRASIEAFFRPDAIIDRQLRTTSFGQSWYNTKVVGPYKIAVGTSTCAYSNIANLGLSAAQAAGIDINAYSRKAFIFPKISACSWLGMSYVGSLTYNTTRTWINGTYNYTNGSALWGHELGHALGLRHTHSWDCTGVLTGSCVRNEYGLEIDMMGRGSATYSARGREVLGWWRAEEMPLVGPGTYVLSPYLSQESGIKGLKIADTVRGGNHAYYLEYRVINSAESNAPSTWPQYYAYPSVILRRTSSADMSAEILDLTPGSKSNQSDFMDGGFIPGRVFRDGSGLSITVTAMDAISATVVVAR